MNDKHKYYRFGLFGLLVISIAVIVASLAWPPQAPPEPAAGTPAKQQILLATTTSTRDSGLLDLLLPVFEERSGYRVKLIAVGSGQALALGREGNADVLLVHAPAAEKAFMEAGYGIERRLVMHNDFVVAGPAEDPAGIRRAAAALEAFQMIAGANASFLSRGDDSGTHKLESELWQQAGIQPPCGGWYLETGQGMGATLTIASSRGFYTLSDRATYLSMRQNLELEVLFEGDPALVNTYHVILVNPALQPQINRDGARAFADFLTSPEAQNLIAGLGKAEFGQPLFYPDNEVNFTAGSPPPGNR